MPSLPRSRTRPKASVYVARATALCLGLCVMSVARGGRAQVPASSGLRLDFSWSAPVGCPTREQVVEQLSRAVDAGGKQLPALTARARIEQHAATWRLELETEMDGRRGARVLEADSCDGLARAATLVLALTLGEGLARRQAAAQEREQKPPGLAPAQRPAPRPTPPAAGAGAAAHRAGFIWLGGGVGTDALGALGTAIVLGADLRPGLLQLGTRVEATLPRSTPLPEATGYVRGFGFSAELQACLAPRVGAFLLSLCASGGLTWLHASGEGTARDAEASVPLYALGPGLGVAWLAHERLFLRLSASSRFFFERPRLVVEGLERTRRVESSSTDLALGAGVRF